MTPPQCDRCDSPADLRINAQWSICDFDHADTCYRCAAWVVGRLCMRSVDDQPVQELHIVRLAEQGFTSRPGVQ
jgi:hypothetical protein